MKLSSRSTYGVRAILALARKYGEGPMMVKEIADRERLPEPYLEQIMMYMRKARLVSATRGVGGGYFLSRPPIEITLAEIVEALEGPLSIADCPTGAGCCGQPESCVIKGVWDEAGGAMREVLKGVTLLNLLERQQAKEAESGLMYVI